MVMAARVIFDLLTFLEAWLTILLYPFNAVLFRRYPLNYNDALQDLVGPIFLTNRVLKMVQKTS